MLTQPALETAIEVSYETRNFHATCIYGDYTVPTSLPIETASQRLGSIVESIEKIDVAEGSPAKTLSRDTYGNFIIVGWYLWKIGMATSDLNRRCAGFVTSAKTETDGRHR